MARQFFQHVAVANLGTHQLHTLGAQCQLHGHVGHLGTHHARHQLIAHHALARQQVQQLVTVEQASAAINHLQAVRIAIQGDTEVRMVGAHRTHQRIRVGRTHLLVDVQAIRRTANRHHVGTQLVEYLGRDLVGRAMCRIHHDAQALERKVIGKRALAELDVATCRIVQSARLAQAGRVNPHRRFVHGCFNRKLPCIRQLGARSTEEFDAVVRIRVVAGTDDHTQAGALGTRQVRHTRCR